MKKLRVLVLMHEELVPPDSLEGVSDQEMLEWKVEYDICTALQDIGHAVRPLGVKDDLGVIRRAMLDWKPHIAFNLLEEFHGIGLYDHPYRGVTGSTHAQRWQQYINGENGENGLQDQVDLANEKGKRLVWTEYGLWDNGDNPAWIRDHAAWVRSHDYSYHLYNNVGSHKLSEFPNGRQAYTEEWAE